MHGDPDPLTALGQAVLHHGPALARTDDGRIVALAHEPIHSPFDLKGLRVGPCVDAIALPLGWDGGRPVSAIAARRCGEMLVATRPLGPRDRPGSPATLVVIDQNALVVDLVRRIMGLPTSPAPATITSLHDTLWLDRMIETCLAAPAGEPPPQAQLLALHPSARSHRKPGPTGTQAVLTAEVLRHLRSRPSSGWPRYHDEACDGGVAWAGVGPALAAWFDPGSLARWLFGMLPEPAVMLSELGDLVPQHSHRSICEVLGCSLSP